MSKDNRLLLGCAIVAVLINLILPAVVKPMATEKQIKPPNGAANLSIPDQVVHMLVHHAQVPLTSSVIVAVIVVLSVIIGKNIL